MIGLARSVDDRDRNRKRGRHDGRQVIVLARLVDGRDLNVVVRSDLLGWLTAETLMAARFDRGGVIGPAWSVDDQDLTYHFVTLLWSVDDQDAYAARTTSGRLDRTCSVG